MYEQRDIVLIPFPYSDLTGSKQRPALIISNQKLNNTEDRICCLITTNKHKSDLLITKKDFQEGTLPFKSFIRPSRVFTIHKNIIKRKLCKIRKDFHEKVLKEIFSYLNILTN